MNPMIIFLRVRSRVRPWLTIWLFCCFLLLSFQARALAIYDSIWVNNDTVGKYNKLEVSVIMTAQYMNPFDYSQVNLRGFFTSPSGTVYTVDGFYFQDFLPNPPNGALVPLGTPYWKIRFCPRETGTWSYVVVCKDATGTTYSGTFYFVCIPSSSPGFISNSSTYFQKFSNGEPFFPVGMSIPWNLYAGGFYIYETWMDSLVDNHANFIKIIMAPWSFGIEWSNTGLGNYANRMSIAWWLDWVLNKSEEEGLYLQLCPLIHNEVSTLSNNDWQWSPYNADNGGPCTNTWDFYTNSTAIYYYKQKLRYINARWGYSAHLSAWELFTETDNTGDFDDHQDDITAWLIQTGQYLNSLDIHHRPVSPSYANFSHDPDIWEQSMTDFTQIHMYRTTPDLELALWAGTRHYLTQWDKPNIIGEFGLGHAPSEIISLDPNGISLHNSLWATALSGSFGAATPWHWDSYIHTQHLYRHFKPVSLFMQSVPLLQKNYQPVSVFCTANNNMDAEILPGYKEFSSPSPENEFTVETCGDLVPRNSYLSYMLYGYLFNNDRNPPHFFVNYTKPGQFKVKTGSNVLLSTLKIYLDGVQVLSHTAAPNSTYAVNVGIGEHEIFVDNSGSFYIEVEKYVFVNYAPVCRSFALKSPNQVSGWVQNRYYNYEYISQYGTPSPLSGGVMNFSGLNNSYYSVQWYNGSSGLPDSSAIKATIGGSLAVTVPPIVWDAAYKISYLNPSILIDFTVSDSLICHGDTVTFHDTSTGIVAGRLWQFPGGTPSSSTQADPQVIYKTSGTFNVTLNAYNAFDSVAMTDTALIHVIGVPSPAGIINGLPQVCQGPAQVPYQIDPIPETESYHWTLPPGATGNSSSSAILVTFGPQSASGTISVYGINKCGEGVASSLPIGVGSPPQAAGPVQGAEQACEGETGTYFIEPVLYAESYQWLLPQGMSGTSLTNQITITFDTVMAGSLISVRGVNPCGMGTPAILEVNVSPVPAIIQQPASRVVEFSQNALFQIPLREDLNYQWQTINSVQQGWVDLADTGIYTGTSTHSMSILSPSPSLNEKQYRCIVSGDCDPPAVSQTAKLYVVPPGWMMTLTPTHHLLHILVSSHPTINGQPITVGDYIGVFFEQNGQPVCAGATRWKGTMPVDIQAYGDDPTTPERDGFMPGEPFIWKIHSISLAEDFEALPKYVLGPKVYTPGGQTLLGGLAAFSYIDPVEIPAGWSGISSYVVPINDSVEVMFGQVGDALEVLSDQEGVYWPDGNVNTLISWDPGQGYYIKTNSAVNAMITGSSLADSVVDLLPGWNLLPVISPEDISTLESTILTAPGESLEIVKEIAGPKIWWPAMNIYTLTGLESGKAYLIRVTAPCSIVFPLGP